MTCRRTKFKHYVDELQKKKNRSKSSVRAKVEHPFRILKRAFGFDKVRYRDLAKNHHRLCANFALVNLYMHRKRPAVLGQNCVRRHGNRPRNESNSSQNQPILPSSRATPCNQEIRPLRRGSLTSRLNSQASSAEPPSCRSTATHVCAVPSGWQPRSPCGCARTASETSTNDTSGVIPPTLIASAWLT